MADNVTSPNPATFAADDIGGVHFPRMKLVYGADGQNEGDVSVANPLPVAIGTPVTVGAVGSDVNVTNGGVFGVQVDASTLPDGAATEATLSAIAGYLDTETAAIVTAVQILDNAISGSEMQVDVVAALPAGTNAIGKLAANSGVDIGDVDILSIAAGDNNIGNVDVASIAAGDNNIGNVDIASIAAGTNNIGDVDVLTVPAPLNVTGAGSEATALRVSIGRPATAYCYLIASQVHVASANTVHWDVFNADSALVVRVVSIRQIPNITTAVTGIVFDWLLERTTAVGTGGSALTAWLADLNDTALDADITARSKPTGGATASTDLFNYSLSSEETNTATIQVASMGGLELVPPHLRPDYGGKGIVLRQNQGLRCVQITNSNAGNTGWLISFTVE